MCNKGRRQSPINVEPDKLLFDPYLRPLHIDKHKVFPSLNRKLEFLLIDYLKFKGHWYPYQHWPKFSFSCR
jgi:hypothetical protein